MILIYLFAITIWILYLAFISLFLDTWRLHAANQNKEYIYMEDQDSHTLISWILQIYSGNGLEFLVEHSLVWNKWKKTDEKKYRIHSVWYACQVWPEFLKLFVFFGRAWDLVYVFYLPEVNSPEYYNFLLWFCHNAYPRNNNSSHVGSLDLQKQVQNEDTDSRFLKLSYFISFRKFFLGHLDH